MLLLDTHTFLWFINADNKLPKNTSDMIEEDQTVFVSIASFWEITIKNSLGKLDLDIQITDLMSSCVEDGLTILPIKASHLEVLKTLPWIHRDPFDRLLISQAISEDLTFVTVDENIKKYDLKTTW